MPGNVFAEIVERVQNPSSGVVLRAADQNIMIACGNHSAANGAERKRSGGGRQALPEKRFEITASLPPQSAALTAPPEEGALDALYGSFLRKSPMIA